MSGIFVYDNNTINLPEADITNFIKLLAPKPPYNFVNTGKGIIYKFLKDEDVNFIFTPHVISCFEKKGLNVSLSLYSQRERNIYISDPSEHLTKYSEREFISDIWVRYNINISSFKTFKSAKTSRHYFIITPSSSLLTKNILKGGKITIFNVEFPVQAKRGSTYSNSAKQPTPLQSLSHGYNKVHSSSQGSGLSVHSNWCSEEFTQPSVQFGQAQGLPATLNAVTQHQTTPMFNGTVLYTDQPPSVIPKRDPSSQHPPI